MNTIKISIVGFLVVAGLLWSGCASSSGTSEDKQDQSTPSTVQKPGDQPAQGAQQTTGRKADTLDVTSQNAQRPPYQSTPPQSIEGAFAVQVGAYKMQDNADRVASLARERFGKNVVTILDNIKNLYKVMVGNFVTRDEARKFRDEMYQKYPSDYKDAWVSELTQK